MASARVSYHWSTGSWLATRVEAGAQFEARLADEAVLFALFPLQATDDPLHGQQEGRFFHGYYKSYCYLPLYIFCGEHLLCARLRPADRDAAAGSVKELARLIGQIRRRWPGVAIIVRFTFLPGYRLCRSHTLRESTINSLFIALCYDW